MSKTILIDASNSEQTRIAVTINGKLDDFEIESNKKNSVKGDVYLAKITRVEPSLQAAFVEFGANRNGFLPLTEIHPDYFKIPSTDKDQETIVDFNKNFFTKLSYSYFEFIKKNNIDDLIDPLIKFDRKYKNWSFINKSIILAIFSEIEISKKDKIKILINDYFNISKSLITKKEIGMINAITDKYINEKKIIWAIIRKIYNKFTT